MLSPFSIADIKLAFAYIKDAICTFGKDESAWPDEMLNSDRTPLFHGFTPSRFSLKTRLQEQRAALLVIDVQDGFLGGKKDPKYLTSQTAALAEAFEGAGGLVIHIAFVDKNNPARWKMVRHGDPNFVPRKERAFAYPVAPGSLVFCKTKNSAFYDHAWETCIYQPLDEYLKLHGITTLVVCGVNGNACVSDTVSDAKKRGYETGAVTDIIQNRVGNKSREPLCRFGLVEAVYQRFGEIYHSQSLIPILKDIKAERRNALLGKPAAKRLVA